MIELPDDADVVATVTLVCPQHLSPDAYEELCRYVLVNHNGHLQFLASGSTRDLILGRTLAVDSSGGVGTGRTIGAGEEGKGWFREIFECRRPSCNYRAERRLREWRDQIRAIMTARMGLGFTMTEITNVENPRIL